MTHDNLTEAGGDRLSNAQHGPFGGVGGVSYLDNLSSAQYGTAKATMGEGASLPQAGTPVDRINTRLYEKGTTS